MLSQKQVESYREDGYITVRAVFPSEQIAALRQVADEFVEQSRAASEHTADFDLEPGHSAAARACVVSSTRRPCTRPSTRSSATSASSRWSPSWSVRRSATSAASSI